MTLRERIPVCEHGKKDFISNELIEKLSEIESIVKTQLEYNSGYRCPECNVKAGGVTNSAHVRGNAVDIRCSFSGMRYTILSACYAVGIKRVGIGKNFIHIDIDSSLPQEVVWMYG